ncbi:uncharacterized protein N7496_009007 [Penicillium cataractarum]|uniref:DUF7587 domain-containing protein n=1 Tax=Penicillium cataractarum TaxID=2100454 RepID=A0A9W9RZG7_9EURO|nr:uncharacterized protein N7496_009007 [Penicillium cataractarum]KAJ5369247.1 hypothetical protein N7496_009007 [Penicillium cataractarum]
MNTANSARNPRLSWNTYHRQVLCCLYRFFECNKDQLSALFSTIFRADLIHCGFGNNDISYVTLNAQWSWLKREKRPVWHHVHIDTEFRTDREWQGIIHKIRITAFELGLRVQEKLFDTICIPNDDFDVNNNFGEYLTSVLLASQAGEQSSSTAAGAGANDDVVTEDPFVGESSSENLLSPFTVATGTPTSEATTILSGDNRKTPDIHIPVVNSPPRAEIYVAYNPSQDDEPLVTSHGKVCFWCVREGEHPEDHTPTASRVDESPQGHNQEVNEPCVRESPTLDAENVAPADLNMHDSNHLPGLCGVDELPPLLYRWSNTNSQGVNTESILVAGWFTGSYPNVTFPGQLSQEEFLGIFTSHVTRVHIPTPFISAFARPLAPIHRALRNRDDAKISVVDPRKLPTPVFNAQPLAQTTGTTVRRWKGYGEFAIWGYVPSEAVVCTFDIATLEDVASRDLEIQQFLQLSLIQAEGTCHRRLRQDLRLNLQTQGHKDHSSILVRLAQQLGVTEEYCWYFATDIHQAWTMNLGDTCRDSEELLDSASSPEPVVSEEIHYALGNQERRVARGMSESTRSYVPPKSDDGSCSESSSEENNMSQSPEAHCPRRDTPSPDFSVASDTDNSVQLNVRPPGRCPTINEVEMLEVAVPPTPPSTSRYFHRPANVSSTVPLLAFGPVNLSTALNDCIDFDDESQWPSDGETFNGNDTPTTSRYFDPAAASRGGLQERNLFVLGGDEMMGI